MIYSVIAICLGASAGALLRWWLAIQFNAFFSAFPLGTLIANLAGGYLIGVAVAFFSSHPQLSPQWRLLTVTGFLGGLTTFSMFSSEVVAALMADRLGGAGIMVALHVLGSLFMTLLGIWSVGLMRTAAL